MKNTLRFACFGTFLLAGALGAIACSSSDDKKGGASGDNPKSGYVTITSSKLSFGATTVANYSAAAGFVDGTGTSAPKTSDNCQKTTESGCEVEICTVEGTDGGIVLGDGGLPKVVHAGAIDISGGQFPAALKLSPKTDGTYAAAQGSKSAWSGGEDIKIHAAGDSAGVGEFTASLKAPSNIKVSGPTWNAATVRIPRSKDLDLTWTTESAASGQVKVVLLSSASTTKTVGIQCTFPASDKKAKIPTALLGKLESGQGLFYVRGIETATQTVTGYDVEINLISPAAREGGQASSAATFE